MMMTAGMAMGEISTGITLGYQPLPRCGREYDSFHSRYRKATSALCPPSEAAILKIGPAAARA
jgi:hypothetical protein